MDLEKKDDYRLKLLYGYKKIAKKRNIWSQIYVNKLLIVYDKIDWICNWWECGYTLCALLTIYCMRQGPCAFDTMLSSGMQPLLGV